MDEVALRIACDGDMMAAMAEWRERECSLYLWLKRKIIEVAERSAIRGAEDIKRVLKIHDIGDKTSRDASAKAIALGAEKSEVNCYVDNGIVHSSVWFRMPKGGIPYKVSGAVIAMYRDAGFEAATWYADVPEACVVMAEIPYSDKVEV